MRYYSVEKLFKLLLSEDVSVLTAYLEGTPVGSFLEQQHINMVTSTRVAFFYHQQLDEGKKDDIGR